MDMRLYIASAVHVRPWASDGTRGTCGVMGHQPQGMSVSPLDRVPRALDLYFSGSRIVDMPAAFALYVALFVNVYLHGAKGLKSTFF